jgi:hypothetical protein
MTDTSGGPGWWQASDGKWYPPEQHPAARAEAEAASQAATTATPGRGPIGKPRRIGLTILVSIVTFGIWTLLWSYWNGAELKNYRRDGLGGGIYLLFTFLLSPLTMFFMANEVENMYREEGRPPEITTLWGLWFLLPLIGHIVWYVKIQGAINKFWEQHGSDPASGIT